MSYPNITDKITYLEQRHIQDVSNIDTNKANKTDLNNYLPLSGGNVTGAINMHNYCIWVASDDYPFLGARRGDNNDKHLIITGGTGTNKGGAITMFGCNEPFHGNPGGVTLSSCDANNNIKYMAFKNNGELLINNNIAVTMTEAVNVGEQWYWKFSNGMMFVGGITTFGGVGTITFCHSFSYPPNHISVTARHSISFGAVITSEVLAKTATYFQLSQRLDGVYQTSINNGCRTEWLAIGWWR